MKDLKTTLRQELNTGNPRMIGIKGEWGVGKTYFWRKLRYDRDLLPAKGYSYISLFGMESVDRLRREILGKIELSKSTKRPGRGSPLRRADQFLRNTKFKGTGAPTVLADWIEDWLVRNCLICIDDIERMDPDLTLASVFGYLNFLKEERECSIVLIFNEEKLEEERVKELAYYREKVLDREFLYNPEIEENLKVVFGSEDFDAIKNVFVKAGINNLRLMFKAQEIVEYFKPHLETYYPCLWEVFSQNCANVVVAFHTTKEPNVRNYLLNTSQLLFWVKESTVPENLKELFQRIDYVSFESNSSILEYLEEGWVDFEKNQKRFASDDRWQRNKVLSDEFNEILDFYRNNFQVEREYFTSRLYNFLKDNCNELRLVDISAAAQVLRDLDKSKDFRSVFECAASSFVSHGGDWKFLMAIPDLETALKEAVDRKLREVGEDRPLEELFVSLSGPSGYEPEDFSLLGKFSGDQIGEWLLDSKRADLIPRIRNIKHNADAASKEFPEVPKKLNRALSIVKEKSEFKRFQIETLIDE